MSSTLWDTVYYLNGLGLADFLTDWMQEDNGWSIWSTRYGERMMVQKQDYATIVIVDDWAKWRENVGYYYASYSEWSSGWDEDIIIDVFVWKLCTVLGILDALEGLGIVFRGPDVADELLFL